MYDDDEVEEDIRQVEKERRRKAMAVKNKAKSEEDKWLKQKGNVSRGRDRRRERQELRDLMREYR